LYKKIILLLCLFVQAALVAQQTPVQITWVTDKVNFDGLPDEHFWESINSFEVTRQSPDYKTAPSGKLN
jgi:hypothetical protein